MMRATNARRLRHLVPVSLVFFTGCASSSGGREAHLPFRVAVAPVTVRYVDAVESKPATPAGPLSLAVDVDRLTERIAQVLGRHVFADAVVVDLPTTSHTDASEGDRLLAAAASGRKANLLVQCDLKITRSVETQRNDRLWLNLVLFAIGGPITWFVADRSYSFEAHMFAQVHQLEPIVAGAASLADGRARLASAHASVQQVEMNLIDRAGSNPLPYLGSIVIPAAFLVTESAAARVRLEDELCRLLAADIARQVAEQQHQIAMGGLVSDIGVADLEVTRVGNQVRLRGAALLRTGAATRLESYSVSLGANRVEGQFETGTVDPVYTDERTEVIRYPFDVSLPASAAGAHFELEITGGGRDRPSRSFCIPLVW